MTRPVSLARFLTQEHPPLGSLAVDPAEFSEVRHRAPAGFVVRELRGSRMRTIHGVFDEFAAAFQFPYYFGANKDAFDECLRDLDESLGAAPGYLAVIRDSAELLAEQPAERGWFAEAVRDGAEYWARREVRFRVVLQGEPAPVRAVPLTL
ncbi:barstar family protein [Nocardia asteroides]|uniref:barstar family protein n=1 Tax=Nocardia asteroides TaxID=1824 RepID=UPI001E490CD3|nr:barstar family protein [Nocardia asteroides]UGT60105.1 barstar family protein [Nocardia asteroides]